MTDLVGPPQAGSLRQLYPESSYDTPWWGLVTMTTDATYTCPTRRLAVAASTHGTVYRYLFTHVMEGNDPSQTELRAFHTLEDTFLWHHFYPLLNGDPYVATPAEEALAAKMAAYWTNFAKTGNPNGAGVPAWPTYYPAGEAYLVLDNDVHADAAYHVPQCDFLDQLDLDPTSFKFVCAALCRSWDRRPPVSALD